MNVGDHYSGSIVGIMDYNFGNPFLEVTTPGLTAIHDGVTRETTDSGRARRARGRDVQRREPRADEPAVEVRRARDADRQQPALARPDRGRGGAGQQRQHRQRRRRRERDAAAARRRDHRRRRPDLRVARDRPGQRPGRRRAGRQHPPGDPVPHRPRPRVRRPAGRRLDHAERRRRHRRARRSCSTARAASHPATRPGAHHASRWPASSPTTATSCSWSSTTSTRRAATTRCAAASSRRSRSARRSGTSRRTWSPTSSPQLGSGRPERERDRARRPERLRVLADGADPRGRRAARPDGHAAAEPALQLRVRGQRAGARPHPGQRPALRAARSCSTRCTSTPSSSTRRPTTTRRSCACS